MKNDVHSVLMAQRQVVGSVTPNASLLYGTSDPVANLGEYVLTTLLAKRVGLQAVFLVYEFGDPRYAAQSLEESQIVAKPCSTWQLEVSRWLGWGAELHGFVETVLEPSELWEMPLGEIASDLKRLRNQASVLVLRSERDSLSTSDRDVLSSRQSLAAWHSDGYWMSGALLHYCLRCYSERISGILHLAPWNEKGRVYQVYAESPALFLAAPWLGIVPPKTGHKWGATFHPECFGSILKDKWDRYDQESTRDLLIALLSTGKLGRKITLEVGEGGFNKV